VKEWFHFTRGAVRTGETHAHMQDRPGQRNLAARAARAPAGTGPEAASADVRTVGISDSAKQNFMVGAACGIHLARKVPCTRYGAGRLAAKRRTPIQTPGGNKSKKYSRPVRNPVPVRMTDTATANCSLQNGVLTPAAPRSRARQGPCMRRAHPADPSGQPGSGYAFSMLFSPVPRMLLRRLCRSTTSAILQPVALLACSKRPP
jgi:hypothetical protein